jgi:hypothetical protein
VRRILLASVALVAATVVSLGATPAWGSHSTSVADAKRASDVLVFLRGPVAAPGASNAHVAELTRQVVVTHDAVRVGAEVLARSDVPDVLFVRATAVELHALAELPDVDAILPNTKVPGPSIPNEVPRFAAATDHGSGPAAGPCGTAADPESDPEALTNIGGAPTDTFGYDGAGVTVAILGDALSPTNPDLLRNPLYASAGSAAGSRVVTDYADFSGSGPNEGNFGAEAFGDASSIAAQGNEVYNLSPYAR